MIHFSALDWFWAGAFLLLMVGGAFFFYRLARRSESDFFLAGRRLPWWLPAASVFSTHTATDTPMWVTGVVYAHGLRGLWYKLRGHRQCLAEGSRAGSPSPCPPRSGESFGRRLLESGEE